MQLISSENVSNREQLLLLLIRLTLRAVVSGQWCKPALSAKDVYESEAFKDK